jgi:hypothetical protein
MQCALYEYTARFVLKYVVLLPVWIFYALICLHEWLFKIIREGLETILCRPSDLPLCPVQEEDPLTWFSL